MSKLVLHEHTARAIDHFAAQPAHAVLLVGLAGTGKGALAEELACLLLDIESLANYPYQKRVTPEKGSISIGAVRELQHFLQLKTIGSKPVRRIAILEHADALTTEAQNAFLKILEEPPADTVLILTADNQRALLPTILSRTQIIPVAAPTETQLREHFKAQEPAAFTQAYFLSGGLPGLMHALLEGDDTHPLMQGVQQAKQLLQQTPFERLALVDQLSKQRESAVALLEALLHIAQTGLEQATKKADLSRIRQWHRILKEVRTSLDALSLNANVKLTLDTLMLSM